MLKPTIKTIINSILTIAIIILSIYAIIWNHSTYLLYKEYRKISEKNYEIVAKNKQLAVEYSKKNSGAEIKEKASKILQMEPYKKINNLNLP